MPSLASTGPPFTHLKVIYS